MVWYGHPSHANPDKMAWKIPKTDWWQSPKWGLQHHVLTHGIPLCQGIFGHPPCLGFPHLKPLFWWSIAMFDYRSGYQPSLRLGLPNDRRDAIGLHGSLEQGVQSMAGRNSAWKHRSYAVVVSMYPHLVVPRRFLVQSSWIPMSVNSPISVGQIMSNLSSYACSFSATMFSKKVPKLTLLATSCGCKTVLSPTLVRPSPDTPTNLIYLKVLGMARCWLVVYLPLWKMMEFVSWDDDYSQLNGKIKSKCSKPPTSNYHILSSSWWPYLGE